MKEDPNVTYEKLMAKYKELRLDPSKVEESLDVLDEAFALRKAGKVSDNSIQAAQYF